MSDSETLVDETQKDSYTGHKKNKKSRDDLTNMFSDFFGCINFKVAIFIFVFGIMIFSDLFIDNILCKINGATSGDSATTKGTFIQMIILVVLYLLVDTLVQTNVL